MSPRSPESDDDDDESPHSNTKNIIEEAFGRKCNLYKDVLECEPNASKAVLRKAYYRAALKHHPDRHSTTAADNNETDEHKLKFQAISLAYQILCQDDLRADYDATGVIPGSVDEDDDDQDKDFSAWKNYFSNIFGKVTTSSIDDFASKYKCSDEERRDVLKYFKSCQGNLAKMLECVMLSEPRDAQRWVEDYIVPAMEAGEIDPKLKISMDKSLQKCRRMAEKENQDEDMQEEEDDEQTDTEASDAEPTTKPAAKKTVPKASTKGSAKASPHKKANKTVSKRKKEGKSMDDLVAAIGKSKNQAASSFASIAIRYGGNLEDDPLGDDEAFAKAQAHSKKKAARRK
jgi:DnaJ family protein C protein 9